MTWTKISSFYTLLPYIDATYSVIFANERFPKEMIINGYVGEFIRKMYDIKDKLTLSSNTNYQFLDIATKYTEKKV